MLKNTGYYKVTSFATVNDGDISVEFYYSDSLILALNHYRYLIDIENSKRKYHFGSKEMLDGVTLEDLGNNFLLSLNDELGEMLDGATIEKNSELAEVWVKDDKLAKEIDPLFHRSSFNCRVL